MPIKVALVEDELETRETLAALIDGRRGLECVAAYATGEAAVSDLPSRDIDVALIDIILPGMDGIECVAKLKARLPQLQVLMLTTYEDTGRIFSSLRAGAKGYLLKKSRTDEIAQAVEELHAGGAPMSMQIARKVVDHFCPDPARRSDVNRLTKREHDVLRLLAKGYHYKEIAQTLDISFCTVRTHLTHIYEKLHVQSRTEATVKFLAGNG